MKRVVSLLLALLLAVALFAGCGEDKKSADTASAESTEVSVDSLSTADVVFSESDGSSRYRIVRPEDDSNLSSVATFLFKKMKDSLGISLRNVLDSEDGTDTYEILLGDTNRPETEFAKKYMASKTGGRYDDYIICTVGKKIVIYSQNPEQLQTACQYFLESFVKKDGVKGGIEYTKKTEGSFESITVNGVETGLFGFVLPQYNSSYLTMAEVEKIQALLYNKTGFRPVINDDSEPVTADCCEIIVGNALRDGVQKLSNYDEYLIKISGKKVYISGGSAHATALAVSEFGKMLEKGNVTDSDSKSGSYEATISTYDKATTYYKAWGDDFDGIALDQSKWLQSDESDSTEGLNGKTSVRSSNPSDVFVTDGKFYICAREDANCYYGGMISTKPNMHFKYGYVEMSATIPHGDGFWVALWARSENYNHSSQDPTKPAYAVPEIDIMECFGNSKGFAANCHSWPTISGKNNFGYEHTSLDKEPYAALKKYTVKESGQRLGDGFHTYGFLWDKESMSFTCDGKIYFTYDTTKSEQDRETFNHSMHLILSMATGYANSPNATVTDNADEWMNTNKFIVDWVNIYQKNDGLHTLE